MLFLNAATFETEHSHTSDGLETTFQVNYLAQFYLTRYKLSLFLYENATNYVDNFFSSKCLHICLGSGC